MIFTLKILYFCYINNLKITKILIWFIIIEITMKFFDTIMLCFDFYGRATLFEFNSMIIFLWIVNLKYEVADTYVKRTFHEILGNLTY